MGVSPSEIVKAMGELPSGRSLGRILRDFLRRQYQHLMTWVRYYFLEDELPSAAPNLDDWTMPMVEAVSPLMIPPYQMGAKAAAVRIARKLPGQMSAQEIFLATQPAVTRAVNSHSYDFCEATNATSRYDLNKALAKLHVEMAEGLELGEAIPKLSARVETIFNDPLRAYTIARTEAARAVHGGQLIAAQESGVVTGMKWMAKKDACPLCLELSGKTVALGQPFAVDSMARAAYQAILTPPRHPHCTCMMSEVIDPRRLRAA